MWIKNLILRVLKNFWSLATIIYKTKLFKLILEQFQALISPILSSLLFAMHSNRNIFCRISVTRFRPFHHVSWHRNTIMSKLSQFSQKWRQTICGPKRPLFFKNLILAFMIFALVKFKHFPLPFWERTITER